MSAPCLQTSENRWAHDIEPPDHDAFSLPPREEFSECHAMRRHCAEDMKCRNACSQTGLMG